MNQIDKLFISQLKNKIPKNISTTEEIASILEINYDAAYRRLKGKVGFSLKESILLSKKFDISLNELFQVGEQNSYIIKESNAIKDINDFTNYLKRLNQEIKQFSKCNDCSILVSAQELPMMYFFDNPLLIKFKLFIWSSILKFSQTDERIVFSDFLVSNKTIEAAKSAGASYTKANVTEVWSFSTINNVLKQLLHFYKMRQINTNDAIELCYALTEVLKNIENKTINGGKSRDRKYNLYSNDMLMMNNSIIFKYKDIRRFAYPYAHLKFFRIENQKVCKDQEDFIVSQMLHSNCITSLSSHEHANFFNLKYDKINQVMAVIKNEETKPVFL